MAKRLLTYLTVFLALIPTVCLAQDKNFSVEAHILGSASFCTNADDFTNANTRHIPPKFSWTAEVV